MRYYRKKDKPNAASKEKCKLIPVLFLWYLFIYIFTSTRRDRKDAGPKVIREESAESNFKKI